MTTKQKAIEAAMDELRSSMLGPEEMKRIAVEFALDAALGVMGWQPIEGAKTDGTAYLVCRYGWKTARVGKYSHGSWWTNGERLNGEPDLFCEQLPAPPEANEMKGNSNE